MKNHLIIRKNKLTKRWHIGPFIIGSAFRVPVGNNQPSKGKVEFRDSKQRFIEGPYSLRIGYGTANEFRATNLDPSGFYWFISFRPPWRVYKSDNCPCHNPADKSRHDNQGFVRELTITCQGCGAKLNVV